MEWMSAQARMWVWIRVAVGSLLGVERRAERSERARWRWRDVPCAKRASISWRSGC